MEATNGRAMEVIFGGRCAWGGVLAGLVVAMVWGPADAVAQRRLTGKVMIDGSSTVAPITMAAAELFQGRQPRVRVTVGISGTGGGFKKFLTDRPGLRTDINDASRPIKPAEIERAKSLGVEFIELPIAIDGIALTVHPGNDFCDYLTVDELRRIWSPDSHIKSWAQVREGFPDVPLVLYGPDTDSGTFDYFTEAIVGKSRSCRSDYTASASDNVLVMGVAGDRGALGYFGYSYYAANRSKLKLLAVEYEGVRTKPSMDVIRSGKYRPLSRPLFLYVNKQSASRAEVKAFIEFLFTNARKIVEHPKVNYVALSPELYASALRRFERGISGSAMLEAHKKGTRSLAEIFAMGAPGR